MTEYFDLWKLVAGLGLFLFAMTQLEFSLKKLAGKRFRQILRSSTDNPIRSAAGGIVATAIVQSSSLIGLIVLAFVGAGIIPLVNAIGIVLGSNLGTTFTGWIVATLGFKLNLTMLVYPLMALGGLSYGILKGHWKYFSLLLVSFAFLLMGLDFMKDSVGLLTKHVDINVLKGYPLIVYLLIGVFFAAIIQSSSATMMLTLSALYAEIIPLQAAAAIVIGADLGTISTILLGSLQGAVIKRRLAMAHVIFNVSIDIVAFISLTPLLGLIEILSIEDPLFALVAFHSIFNLFGLMMYLPFIRQYTRLLENLVKEDQKNIERFITDVPETITDVALEAVEHEVRYLLYLVTQLNMRYMQIPVPDKGISDNELTLPESIRESSKMEHYITVKKLEGKIVTYALKIQLDDVEIENKSKENIVDRIEKLLIAVRSGVYSAKALKDVSENLEAFHIIDNEVLNKYFLELKDNAANVYQSVTMLLENIDNEKMCADEIRSLNEKLMEFHQKYSANIYNEMRDEKLGGYDFSTLLNVNNEIQTSEKALLKSIELL